MHIQNTRLFIALTTFALLFGWIGTAQSTSIASIKVGIVIGGEKKSKGAAINRLARFTCGAAKAKIFLAGYKNIQTLDCVGNVYVFAALLNFRKTNVGFNAATGQIVKL
ncbi:MAG: hypothetical protein L3J32_06375 [Rhizobiaceae bacterium]|nr:hypothetical protein [Rhizobiaceae bacterium]